MSASKGKMFGVCVCECKYLNPTSINKLVKVMFQNVEFYKKNCNLPHAIRHVYKHSTRGEQFATCNWTRVRRVLDPAVTKCTFCSVY
jgi:hypothetical protein